MLTVCVGGGDGMKFPSDKLIKWCACGVWGLAVGWHGKRHMDGDKGTHTHTHMPSWYPHRGRVKPYLMCWVKSKHSTVASGLPAYWETIWLKTSPGARNLPGVQGVAGRKRLAGHKTHTVHSHTHTQKRQGSIIYNCSVVVLSIAIMAVNQHDLHRGTGEVQNSSTGKGYRLVLAAITPINHWGSY